MPYPERLRVWMLQEDSWNLKIIQALMEGVAAGIVGLPLGERAAELGYSSRSAQGDAFEEGWFFGETRRKDRG